jgi:hypothetical protein
MQYFLLFPGMESAKRALLRTIEIRAMAKHEQKSINPSILLPEYGELLSRIGRLIQVEYPLVSIVEVGANIRKRAAMKSDV